MNLEKYMYVPEFWEDNAIQKMKRKGLCGTWVEGLHATGGGGLADRGDMRL